MADNVRAALTLLAGTAPAFGVQYTYEARRSRRRSDTTAEDENQ